MKQKYANLLYLVDYINEFSVEGSIMIREEIVRCQRILTRNSWPIFAKHVSKKNMNNFLRKKGDFLLTCDIAKHLKGCRMCMRKAKKLWKIIYK